MSSMMPAGRTLWEVSIRFGSDGARKRKKLFITTEEDTFSAGCAATQEHLDLKKVQFPASKITAMMRRGKIAALFVFLCALASLRLCVNAQTFPALPTVTNHIARPVAAATASLTISNAAPGEIINLVTSVQMAGATNWFTNQIHLPLTLPGPPSNTVSIYRTYFGAPQNNFIVAFTAPPASDDDNYSNCALFGAASLSGPWNWLGSFPNGGQLVALIVTNAGGNQFYRAANMFTPTE